jgi:polyisoprenoid-binding protein YceI
MKIQNSLMLSASLILYFSAPSFAKSYQVEDGDTSFTAKAKSQILKITGEGARPSGLITQNKDQTTGQIKIKLDDFKTGINLRDEHMKNKYLEVKTYPEAELEIQAVDLKAQTFTGVLSLHGVKKKIEGGLQTKFSEGHAKVESQFQIHLSDFQIPTPSFMDIQLVDQVDVKVNLSLAEKPDGRESPL